MQFAKCLDQDTSKMVRPLVLVAVADLPKVLGEKEHVDVCGVVVAVGDKVGPIHLAMCCYQGVDSENMAGCLCWPVYFWSCACASMQCLRATCACECRCVSSASGIRRMSTNGM